ncbi:hypothetical protein [Paenibacillus polymyxa]|uniref:hypothetical protein n=1 Tax=Paenibacillus polymyxa TaxID=1406 RepID=UPI0032AEFEA3
MQAVSIPIFRVSIEDIFKCPKVFKIQVDEDPNIIKWILMLSVGDRNGENPNDSEPPDAAVTWDGIPNEDARKFWVGWMNNWRYASTLPSEEWRGHMSIPREIQLRTYSEEFA